MKTVNTTLTTTALFSDDGKKRYLLRKEWDASKPSLAIIMLAPSEASGIHLDSTTLLVLNNASRLGFGSVSILNLFATLNDFSLTNAEEDDAENLKEIIHEAKKCDSFVYAPGVGKANNHNFQARSKQILEQLKKYEDKLYCISDKSGMVKFVHPLTPCVREWNLQQFKVSELVNDISVVEPKTDRKGSRSCIQKNTLP